MIIATLLVKNEEDIIDDCMRFHLTHGVDKVIVTDNGSTDRTKEMLARYPEVVELIDEPDKVYRQSVWVTRMARLACKFKPDWVVHLDADEFWHGLKNVYKMEAGVVYLEDFYEHPPLKTPYRSIKDRPYYYARPKPLEHGRLVHSPSEDAVVFQGNHTVANVGGKISYTEKIYLHHYSNRSFEQFTKKAKQAECYNNYKGPAVDGSHWRRYHQLWLDGKLRGYYDSLIPSDVELSKMKVLVPPMFL